MSRDGSVTHWIHEIKGGNPEVAQDLWQRYFDQMVRLARTQMQAGRRRVADEEDVAVSVFESFCRAAKKGRFPDLADRDTLWRLLVKMTSRKVIDRRRHDGRLRRGGGQVAGESAMPGAIDEDNPQVLAAVIGREPTPEFIAIMTEQFDRLIDCLEDPQLQELAIGKMEGYSNDEMAEKLGCSLRTVERRLRLIRETIKQELS